MGTPQYPPAREADLITAAQTFHDVAAVTPSTYSLQASQLTSLATTLTDFQTKWDVCQVPGTKTKVAVQQKDASKADLVLYLRSLVRIVQNAPTTTNALAAGPAPANKNAASTSTKARIFNVCSSAFRRFQCAFDC